MAMIMGTIERREKLIIAIESIKARCAMLMFLVTPFTLAMLCGLLAVFMINGEFLTKKAR